MQQAGHIRRCHAGMVLIAATISLALVTFAPAAHARELTVVASSSSTAALVREIAGDEVQLTILAPPDRDLHYLQVRPGMMRALRGADLVTSLGADLEIGWLPVAIQQAANPSILPGRTGYFEAAVYVELDDATGVADRALGDVHPFGNPHVNMDPERMATISLALADRLGELDPDNAEQYSARAEAFGERVRVRMVEWRAQINPGLNVVLYHRDAKYLLDLFEIPLLGLVEPVPGVPPSGAHIKQLKERLTGIHGLIIHTPYQSDSAPRALANATGWQRVKLPLEPPLDADGEGYLEHIDRWVSTLTGGPN